MQKATEANAMIVKQGWKNPTLTAAGLYYPFGPCQICLQRWRIGHVLQLLPDVFRKLSLEADYHEKPISVVCCSLEQVKLGISIFTSPDDKDKIIIDIEHRGGDVATYHTYASQVKGSLLGHHEVGALHTYPRLDYTVRRIVADDPSEPDVLEALGIAWSMITTGRYDAQCLGFETLIHMTNIKNGILVARTVSKSLLEPKDKVQEDLARTIFEYAFHAPALEQKESHHASTISCADDETEENLAYLALVTLTQVLEVVPNNKGNDVHAFLHRGETEILQGLIGRLRMAYAHPHQAYHAARSLAALCNSIPMLLNELCEHVVREAEMVGNSCHMALSVASHELLLLLQTCKRGL